MFHHLLITLAAAIRFMRRLIFRFILVIVLVGLNVATVVSDNVYDRLNRLVWGGVQLVSEIAADHRPRSRTEIDADLTRSRTDLKAAEATVLAVRDDLEQAKARNRALEIEAASQKQRVASAEVGARRLEAELDTVRLETAQVRADLDGARAETSQIRRQLDDIMSRNRSLSDELDASKGRIDRITTEINLSKKNRSEAVEAATALRSRIVQSIRRNAASEAFEAVPFVGTAVFLGTVAYDLNDSCHQLRELEALDAILRDREPEQINEAMCLLSYEDMVAAFTGQDRGYARCVSDRLTTKELNPASCTGYEPAVPQINDSPLRPQDRTTEQFSIN
jgi:uncharacterized protein (DUF3084 family)